MKIQKIQQLSVFQLKKLFYYLYAENGKNVEKCPKCSFCAESGKNAENGKNAKKRQKHSKREISAILGISRDSIRKYEKRFIEANLTYPPSNEDLEAILAHSGHLSQKVEIDFAAIRNQQDLYPKATVRALYEEWVANRNPDEGIISYSQFAKRFRQYNASLRISLRNQHRVAESVFVDYSGDTVPIYCLHTGKVTKAQIFVGVLGYSKMTYCEATATQNSLDWNASLIRMFNFFGGVPETLVHDNLKAAVVSANRHTPVLNLNFQQLCEHYDIQPLPTRVRKPKDKASVEGAVSVVQRWILFRLRKQKFYSLDELNRAIVPLLDALNRKPFQKLSGSRYQRFTEVEKKHLCSLPATEYRNGLWAVARIGTDYHVKIGEAYYSVPYIHRQKQCKTSEDDETVKVYVNNKLVASHIKAVHKDATVTEPSHQPPNHRAVTEVTKASVLKEAEKYGRDGIDYFDALTDYLRHPHALARFMGGFRKLTTDFNVADIACLCRYAADHRIFNIGRLQQVTKNMDVLRYRLAMPSEKQTLPEPFRQHSNLRGAAYYQQEGEE